MRSDPVIDQAEGLRHLLVRAATRVVTVTAARTGLGATSVIVNLAAALARTGKDVLILDEHLTHDNVGNMLALRPRHDLFDVVRCKKSLREIMLQPRQGVHVLPVARTIQSLPLSSPAERERLLECLDEASRGMDVVLVDAAAHDGGLVSSSLAPDQPLLLVLNATASAITESYSLIKRMALQDGRRNFGVVVNKVCDEREAQAVFGNMAQVARRHLQVRVEYMGYIPFDEKLKRATQLCRPVLEAFPNARSSLAFVELGGRLILMPVAGDKTGGLPDVMQRLMRQSRPLNMAYTT